MQFPCAMILRREEERNVYLVISEVVFASCGEEGLGKCSVQNLNSVANLASAPELSTQS